MMKTTEYKDFGYIRMATMVAQTFSKCKRAKYGTVWLNSSGHVVGTSWNGKPKGVSCDNICLREDDFYQELGLPIPIIKPACCLHAEDNGASWTDPEARKDGTVYISGIPCDTCYLRLLNTGVARIVYLKENNCNHICNIINFKYKEFFKNKIVVVEFTEELWRKEWVEDS